MSAPSTAPARVVAVVVTWNRRELLQEAVSALRGQHLPPVAVVVVDNASDDGTAELLAGPFGDDLDVVTLTRNIGGAGGFSAGMRRAFAHDPEVVWLLDDDTVPEPGAAAELVRAWQDHPGARPAVVASKVVWIDGRDHPMNTPRRKPRASEDESRAARSVGAVPIRSASFVSIMCDAHVVRERGLPIADYFLWNDDFEYSTRLIRGHTGLYVPASVVVHKTRAFGATDADPGDRFFYEVRNKLWLFGRSAGLTPAEKVLYGGSTLRRWVRTYRSSSDRPRLRRAFVRGLRAGTCTKPRTDREVLDEAGWTGSSRTASTGPESTGPESFSLLMSTWAGDDADQLRVAFRSSVDEQTRRPDEVVIVRDGPVPAHLQQTLAELVSGSPVPVQLVELETNVGLGPALEAGLRACRHEVVARMDSDDISAPHRFEQQLPLIEAGADIVGSGLWEMGASPDDVVGRRTPPLAANEIRRVVRFRDPFNHPTVVYRRSAVWAAGGYSDLALLEDYLLFARMIAGGAVPANLPDPLVFYRVGEGAYARRGGLRLLRSELALQRRFRTLGLTSRTQFWRNVLVRGGYRLVPQHVRKVAYRSLLANRSGTARG